MPSSQAALKRSSSIKVLALFDDTPLVALPIGTGSPFSPTQGTSTKKKSFDRGIHGTSSPKSCPLDTSWPIVGVDGYVDPPLSDPTQASPKKKINGSTREKRSSTTERIDSGQDAPLSTNRLVKSTEFRASLSTMTYSDHQEYIQRMMQAISGTDDSSKNIGLSNRTSSLSVSEDWMESCAPSSSSDATFEPGRRSQPRLNKQRDDDYLDKSKARVESRKSLSTETQNKSSRSPWSSSRKDDSDQYAGPMQLNDRQDRPDLQRSRPPSGSSRNLTQNIPSGRSNTRESHKEVGKSDRRQSTGSSTSMKKAQSERNLLSLTEESDADRDHHLDSDDRNWRHQFESSTYMKRATSERNLISLSQDIDRNKNRDHTPRHNEHRRSSSPMKRHQSKRILVPLTEESDHNLERTRDSDLRHRRQDESSRQMTTAKSERDSMSMPHRDDRERNRDHNPRDYDYQSASSSPMKRRKSERNPVSLKEESYHDRYREDGYLQKQYESKSREERGSRNHTQDRNQRDNRSRSSSSAFDKTARSERDSKTLSDDRDRDNTRDRDQLRRSSISTSSHTGPQSDRKSISLSETRDQDRSRYRGDKYDQSMSTIDSDRKRTSSTNRDRRHRSNGSRSSTLVSMRSDHGDSSYSRTGESLVIPLEPRRSSKSPSSSQSRSRSRNSRHRGSRSRDEWRRDVHGHKDSTEDASSFSPERRRSSKSPLSSRNRSRSRNSRHRKSNSHDERKRDVCDDKDRLQNAPTQTEGHSPGTTSEWQQDSTSRVPDSSSVPTSRSSKSQSRSSSLDGRHRRPTSSSSPRRESSKLSRRSSLPMDFPLTDIEVESEDVEQLARSEAHADPKSPQSVVSREKRRSRRSSQHRSSSSNDSVESRRRSSTSPRGKSSDRKIGRDSKDWKALRDMASSSAESRDGTTENSPIQATSWHGTSESRPRRAGRKSELLASNLVSFPDGGKDTNELKRDESKEDRKKRRSSSKSQERSEKAANRERRRSKSDGSVNRGPSRRQREMEKAAIVLQKWAHRLIGGHQIRSTDEDAVVLQVVHSPFEIFNSRLQDDMAFSEMASKAVLSIQQLVRVCQAKVKLQRLREEKEEQEVVASFHIQRIVRGYLAKLLARKRANLKRQHELERQQVLASIRVQRIVRGHLGKLARERARFKRKQELEQSLARYEPEKVKYIEYVMEKKKIQKELARDIALWESKIQQVEDEYCRELKKIEDTKEDQQRIWGEAIRQRVETEQAQKEAESAAKKQEELANLNPAKEIEELEEEIAAMKDWLLKTEAKLAPKVDERDELERANVEVEKMFHELNEFAKGKVAENKELTSQQLMLTKVLLPKAVKNAETATQEIHQEIRSRLQLRRTMYGVFEQVKARNGNDQSLCDDVEVAIRQCEQELSQNLLLQGDKMLELLRSDMDALFELEVSRLHALGECPRIPASATGWDAIAKGVMSNMGKKKKLTLDELRPAAASTQE